MSAYYYAVKDEELIDLGWTKPEVAKLRTAEKAIYAKRMEADKAERLVSELIAKKQREEIETAKGRAAARADRDPLFTPWAGR